jgi:hypothetical protein
VIYPLGLQRELARLAARQSNSPRNARVREAIQLRARNVCEYCLLPTNGQFHVDHIIPEALWQDYIANRLLVVRPMRGRRGHNHIDNFAWACEFCNEHKGQKVAYYAGRRSARLFDPRQDLWPEHFVFVHRYLFIRGLTDIGRATVDVLGLNDARLEGPLGPRHDAVLVDAYPPVWAHAWLV